MGATMQVARAVDRDLAALVEQLRPSVVAIRTRAGAGSGTAWRNGFVVTNAHVVQGERATVETADGERREARVAGRDPSRDLAALRLEGAAISGLELRDPATLRTGEIVIAAGHPWGGAVAATLGTVSASVREGRAVLADIRLAPGNSGGPLVDTAGRVVGINAMVAGGRGVAIPSTVVEQFLLDSDQPSVPLGITLVAVPAPGLEGVLGLLITGVESGSVAERAGLTPGDVVLAAGGASGSPEQLLAGLRSRRRPLQLDLLRGGERRTLVVATETAEAA
jgi:serine protease Do